MPRSSTFFIRGVALAVLAGALAWGRTHAEPDLDTALSSVFPEAARAEEAGGVLAVYSVADSLLGWAGTGSAHGYGGPLLVLVGIAPSMEVVGLAVVEHRETPVFWSLARAGEYIGAMTGRGYPAMEYEYAQVVAVSGATLSTTAITQSVREAVSKVADEAFAAPLPPPAHPFEFGFLELTVLALLAGGLLSGRVTGKGRGRLRWTTQITGLLVLGFWKESPITLAKLTALMSGFFPDPRGALALYLLVAVFVVTSAVRGRNVYCQYACPFGAAQRCVGVLGGARRKLPPALVRGVGVARNTVVFAILFMAFLTVQPAIVAYEPFSVLFSLRGTTLQWVILAAVLIASLVVRTPWCTMLCPMGTVEVVIRDAGRAVRRSPPPTG